MKLKQLSALLLAVSLAVVPSVRSMDDGGIEVDVAIAEIDIADPVMVDSVDSDVALVSEEVVAIPEATSAGEDKGIEVKGKSKAGTVKRTPRKVSKPSGKTKKSKTKTSKKTPKAKKKAKQKIDKSVVAKVGKYDKKGDIKSFNNAVKGLIAFMDKVEKGNKATVQEKNDLYRTIARISWVSGRMKFNTKAHLKAAIDLLASAKGHKELFSATKMKMIDKWLNEKNAELKNFGKKDAKKEVKKAKKVKKVKTSTAYDKMQQKRAAKRQDGN